MPSKSPRQGHRRHGGSRLRSVSDGDPDAQSTVHVGEHLKALRISCQLTQEQAASRASVTRNTIMDLEKRRLPNPHLHLLLALMYVYDVGSIEELLGFVPSRRAAEERWRMSERMGSPLAGGNPTSRNVE